MTVLRRHAGPAALLLSVLAIVLSLTGLADAARKAVTGHVVRLDKKGRIPARYLPAKIPAKNLPTVGRARAADRLGGHTGKQLSDRCVKDTVDMGTWCLMFFPVTVPPEDAGKNDYFYATQKCAELGGWLPSAAQLIGAAKRLQLSSVLTDSQTTAAVDQDPTDGLKDLREMSGTLITTAAGSSAAGSEGVSDGAKGDPRVGEPDPVPAPANPAPNTLQYVTVYDNGDKGGFAGAKPVSDPERFRCAFGRTQGTPAANMQQTG